MEIRKLGHDWHTSVGDHEGGRRIFGVLGLLREQDRNTYGNEVYLEQKYLQNNREHHRMEDPSQDPRPFKNTSGIRNQEK